MRMSRALVALALGTLVFGALLPARGSGAGTQATPSRIVDRTVTCATGLSGGIREVFVRAVSAHGQGAERRTGYVDVTSNVQPSGRLAYIGQREVALSPFCAPRRASIPLTQRSLTGGRVGQIEEAVDCATPRRVVIRVRAMFRSPARWRRGEPYGFPLVFARGTVTEASFAMATTQSKPLAFATVVQWGKVRLFTDFPDSCIPD